MYAYLLLLLPLLACGADKGPEDLFGPSEDNLIVVDAILIVDQPLPPVFVRRTAAPGVSYSPAAASEPEAVVAIRHGDQAYPYRADPVIPGRYLPPVEQTLIEPSSTYQLSVETRRGERIDASTTTPSRLFIDEVLLLDEQTLEVERTMRRFAEIGDEVYSAEENQILYPQGIIEAVIRQDVLPASYQIAVFNLERETPLLFDSKLIDEEDLERIEREGASPPLSLPEGRMRLPWFTLAFAGRHKVKLFAVDSNWFDLIRTDNLNREGGSGQAGDQFGRPIFNVENGIGLFASAAVDSLGFTARAAADTSCSNCPLSETRERREWSATIDPATGNGRVEFVLDLASGQNCTLWYEISGVAPNTSCTMCDFAWELQLGALTIERDEGGCGEIDELQGETISVGHSPAPAYLASDSTPVYTLYYGNHPSVPDNGDIWGEVVNGWSTIPWQGESAGLWLFGEHLDPGEPFGGYWAEDEIAE